MSPHPVLHPRPRGIVLQRAAAFASIAALTLLAACEDTPAVSTVPHDCTQGEVRLRVGEMAGITEDVQCVLAPDKGARYALAWYDPQLLAVAEAGPEPYSGLTSRVNLWVIEGDGSVRFPDEDPALAMLPETPSDARILYSGGPASTRAVGILGSPGPWSEGDVIRVGDPVCQSECRARVARVVDGWLVFALEESTLGTARAAQALEMLDYAIPRFRQHSLPMLRETFTQELPVTGPESRQLVVLVRGDVSGVAGRAWSNISADATVEHLIEMEMDPGTYAGFVVGLLTHEVAHTFQAEFSARSAPAGTAEYRPAVRWGIEGGATLMETEALRRASGHRFGANLDFRVEPASPVEQALFGRAGLGNGVITAGYDAPSSFMLDLVDRRTRAGDDLATALREISRGAVEGWYGHPLYNPPRGTPPRQGLVRRMQARVPGWDPAEAVLAWTLTAAGDDVMKDGRYQNRAWKRVSDVDYSNALGWGPFREVPGGSNQTQQHSRPAGAAGWMRLTDTGAGVSVRVRSIPAVQWRLLRIE